jgi:hypothetical protein
MREDRCLGAEHPMELANIAAAWESIRELARVTAWSQNTARRYLREGEAAYLRKEDRRG